MLAPEAFLEQECINVATLLDHALRFDYGPIGSEEFYAQCQHRLVAIRKGLDELAAAKPTAKAGKAKEVSSLISKLSELIAHIERAHIGEFSWACGEAFRRHATALCTELKTDDDEVDEEDDTKVGEAGDPAELEGFQEAQEQLNVSLQPLFFILADGGILSYRIRSWQANVDVPTRRIFTITVPTSLRHHVLLHAVLGHELGHAVYGLADQSEDLDKLVSAITDGSVLGDGKKLASWQLQGTPAITHMAKDKALLESVVRYWVTEVVCDIFGLVLMGPSFGGALRTLFDGIDSVGMRYGPKHPPQMWRFEAMARAYRHLGWDKAPEGMSAPIKKAFDDYTTEILKFERTNANADKVFKAGVIEKAVDDVRKFFQDRAPGTAYVVPSAATLDHLYCSLLKLRPPVGQQLDIEGGPFLEGVDYRHVLHAGWLSGYGKPREELNEMFTFLNRNRLCEQAIIQLEAVRIPALDDDAST